MHLAAAPRRELTSGSIRRVRSGARFVRKKVVTSTFTYDNNGNLIQKTVDGTSTTYVWDYANRLTALGVSGAGTTTYGYDAFGARVYQIASTTATTTYPFKFSAGDLSYYFAIDCPHKPANNSSARHHIVPASARM
jgi:YD repeat-containing protein